MKTVARGRNRTYVYSYDGTRTVKKYCGRAGTRQARIATLLHEPACLRKTSATTAGVRGNRRSWKG